MRISPTTFVETKANKPLSRSEFLLRYAMAYGCMLIALAAAQLVSANGFILLLAGLTIIGLPASLILRQLIESSPRWHRLRVFVNSIIVIGSFTAGILYIILAHPELLTAAFGKVLMIDYGVEDSIKLLMELFLIFSAFRALAIINDREAVISVVPSFSAMLLLMVIHRGPQVVFYFVIWTILAAVLFSLDHRAEASGEVQGRITSVEIGQDIQLSTRSLITVMGFSLIIATGIALFFSSRSPNERGQLERMMMSVASRMTSLALNLPDVSVNNGPERQIDYTSGPALPTRTELWRVGAMTSGQEVLRPQYWRMFTLSAYDGKTWSQLPGSGITVARERLSNEQWPRPQNFDDGAFWRRRYRRNFTLGYNLNIAFPNGHKNLKDFGESETSARFVVQSQADNIGFIPTLPVPTAAQEFADFNDLVHDRNDNFKERTTLRVRRDGGIDAGVMQHNQQLRVQISIPNESSYGINGSPPLKIDEKPNPDAELSEQEREANLALPDKLREPSSRLLKFAQDVLKDADPDESDYSKVRRLAAAIESRGVYTLRPPITPTGADAAEYFVMDNPRGYCTYFAGALTVLARLSGVPARVVSGFVNPEWDSETGVGTLREANAHAWTEIWVPDWGWAPVDATPPSDRGDNALSPLENWKEFVQTSVITSFVWMRQHSWFIIFPVLLLFIAGLMAFKKYGLPFFLLRWLTFWKQDDYQTNESQSVQTIYNSYQSMSKRLSRRFRPRTQWETPREWIEAAITATKLQNPQPFRDLTALYERAHYAEPIVANNAGSYALQLLHSLSWEKVEEA